MCNNNQAALLAFFCMSCHVESHNLVFVMFVIIVAALIFVLKNGQPLSTGSLYSMFSKTAYRITGKKTNPHLVRDMVVTHLRGSDASEQVFM